MAKKDNWKQILMFNCKVNLNCDCEKLQCRYINRVWYINGEKTDLGVLGLIKHLKESYKNIRVTWKKQF